LASLIIPQKKKMIVGLTIHTLGQTPAKTG
jgi:hypothetical protein